MEISIYSILVWIVGVIIVKPITVEAKYLCTGCPLAGRPEGFRSSPPHRNLRTFQRAD